MIPNITRGSRIVRLMSYLAGEGRANEHTEQHLVAGDHAIMARHGYAVLDQAAARDVGLLRASHAHLAKCVRHLPHRLLQRPPLLLPLPF